MTGSRTSACAEVWWARRFAGPLALAAALRLTLLAVTFARTGTSVIASGDTESYLAPGRNLLLHGRFVTGALPELDRTPGYPLFLAVVSFSGPAIAAFLQVLLSVISVVLVWRLARAFSGESRIALIAAWIFAVEPLSIIYSVRLLPETLFLALMLLSLERLAVFLNSRHLRVLAMAGLWLAAATFVRPVAYYLPVALALGLLTVFIKVPGLRWKAPVVLLASVLPWLAAWQVRNWQETGFSGFSSIVARNLYFYQAAEVTARVEHRSFAEVQAELGYASEQAYLARHPEQAGWNQASRIAFIHSEAEGVLRAHPGVFLRMYLEGSTVVAFTPASADLLRMLDAWPKDWPPRVVNEGPIAAALRLAESHPWLALVMAAMEAVLLALYLLAVCGVMHGSARTTQRCLLLGVALYFLAASGGAQAVGRYRLPAMPVACILAAAGLTRKHNQSGISVSAAI